MKLAANYLQRIGYRLPTEAEWEYACRAGAVTSRYFGETEDLLPKYAWYLKNSKDRTWPVGSLKPNDLGLFDVHGNVWTWCQEELKNHPQGQAEHADEDKEGSLTIHADTIRVERGGAYNIQASIIRSAFRNGLAPTRGALNLGFRPARTITP